MTRVLNLHRALGAVAFVLATLVLSTAVAHLMPAGKGTLNVVGSKAYLVLSLPVAAFSNDGFRIERLSPAELKRSEEALRQRVRGGIRVDSGGEPAVLEQVLLNLPPGQANAEHDHGDREDRSEDLIVMIVARFASPPSSVALASDLWADDLGSLRIKATVSDGPRTVRSEMGVMSRSRPELLFFASTPTRAD